MRPARRLFALSVPLLSATTSFATDPPPVPRYKLQQGQHLVYASDSHFKHETGSIDSTTTTDVWVTATQPDGSAKLLVLSTTNRGQGTPTYEFLSATLSPAGQIQFDGRPRPGTSLSNIFPPLPTDSAAQAGWQSAPDVFGGTVHYSLVPDSPADAVVFKGVHDDPEAKIYLSSRSATYHFDPARGLLDHADSEATQDYGFRGKATGTTRLKSADQADPATLAQLTADAAAYFAASDAYRASMEAAENASKVSDTLADADQPLKAARSKVTTPAIKDLLASQIDQHKQYLPYLKRSAEKRAAVLNKPAPDFSTTDTAGRRVSLAGLRGKVVLLDFWYRGCGWCIRAMPQLKQLADDFKDQPVALLGMNTDADPEDADFVIKAMSLNYPTLKAEGLPKQFGVDGFPTLILIDQQGVIRDVHSGWSPTLRQDIGDKIRALLKTN